MNKALNTIGMCKGANKISYGETLIKDIKNHSVNLVIICIDTSDNSKKKIRDKCNYYKCEYIVAFLQKDIIKMLSREDPVSAIGIKDSNLAKKIKENLEREGDSNGEK